MKISLKSSAIGLAAFGALAIAAPAWAGCGDAPVKSPAMFEKGQAGDAHLIRVSEGPQIAGLWAVTFYVGNTSQVFDTGYAAWHSDGTEIMNSGGRSPASENFCMGVWTTTGPFSYLLNHYALSYDPATGKLNGKVLIKENVQVEAKGQFYTYEVYLNYSCVGLIADALERAASADRPKIIAALGSSTWSGHIMPYGPTKFVNGQNEGAAPCNTQVLDNDIKVILPKQFANAKAIFPMPA